MKHEILIIDTGLDRMTGPRETNDVAVHAATVAGEEEGSWATQSLARLMRTRLWADPIEREGTYILRARPLGEVLSSYSEKVSRETVPRVEPAGERQHRDLLNSRGSQRCDRRQRGSATHPGVVNDRNVRWHMGSQRPRMHCHVFGGRMSTLALDADSPKACIPRVRDDRVAEACSTYQAGNGCGWGQLQRLRWVFPSVVPHRGDGVIRTAEAAGRS